MPNNNKKIPIYNPSLPRIYDSPNVKVLNTLDDLISKTETELAVGKVDKKPVRISVKVYYLPVPDLDEDENIKLREALAINKKFSEFDRAVFGAVVSLIEAGNKYMTPATIYRLMIGAPEATKISPAQEERIRASLSKMRQIFMIIDYTEQAKMYPDLDIQKCVINDYMLSGSVINVLAGGCEVWAFKPHVIPPLYEYAKKLHQIISIQFEFLQVGGDNSPSRIAARMYMLRRILAKTHKMSNSILYSSIYEAANVQGVQQCIRLREFVHKCLDAWRNLGLIQGYKIRPHKDKAINKHYAIDILGANPSVAVAEDNPPLESSVYDETTDWTDGDFALFDGLSSSDFI